MSTRRFRSLAFQLAVTITVFIFFIEGVLLITSLFGKERELIALNAQVEAIVKERTGVEIKDPLNENWRNSRLEKFAINIILLTCLIVFVVVGGTLYTFYKIGGRQLYRLLSFNRQMLRSELKQYPVTEIPPNEIGELISSQNSLITKVKDEVSFMKYNPGLVFRVDLAGKILKTNTSAMKKLNPYGLADADTCEFFGMEAKEFKGIYLSREIRTMEVGDYVVKLVPIENKEFINCYGTDISDQKKLQQGLFFKSKLSSIGELAAGMAHEINNPLTIIKLQSEIFAKRRADNTLDQDYVDLFFQRVTDATDRVVTLVEGLKLFSHTGPTKTSALDVNTTITETLETFGAIYRNENVNLEVDLGEGALNIWGDNIKLQQVIVNLLNNARDAVRSKESKKIAIRSRLVGGRVFIEIEDNGHGIPDDIKDKIFDTFFTTKDVGKGTGLGLGISRSIIEAFQGDVVVESETNKGTRFLIDFPRCDPSETTNPHMAKKVA